MKTISLILSPLFYVTAGFGSEKDKHITAFGAVADSVTSNAAPNQKDIDEASACGGGRVIVPSGLFIN